MPRISEFVQTGRTRKKPRFKHNNQLGIDASLNEPDHYFTNISIPERVKNAGWILIDTHSQPASAFVNSSHKQYYNKHFKVGSFPRIKNGKRFYELYPMVERHEDPRNIGYCIDSFNPHMPRLTANTYESFWDTRRGKRFSKYIEYRKKREKKREEYNKMENNN